jgi:hypothetical protein
VNPEQNPQDYDEVTRLRLRINHLEIQRDAFAAALKAEVRTVVADILREELRRQVGGLPHHTVAPLIGKYEMR